MHHLGKLTGRVFFETHYHVEGVTVQKETVISGGGVFVPSPHVVVVEPKPVVIVEPVHHPVVVVEPVHHPHVVVVEQPHHPHVTVVETHPPHHETVIITHGRGRGLFH